MKISISYIVKLILILLMSSVGVYVILRAIQVPFTHDESYSFHIFTGNAHWKNTANHHPLNTWLMIFSYKIFGINEFVLRMPNVFAYFLYAFASFKIFQQLKNYFLMLLGVSLVIFNPYVLDFFSLARGYGLALGMGMFSLYICILLSKQTNFKRFLYKLILLFTALNLTVLSNYVFVNFSIAILILSLYDLFQMHKNQIFILEKKEKFIIIFVYMIQIVIIYLFVKELLILDKANQLYAGHQKGFIQTTISELIHSSIYMSYYGEVFWQFIRNFILASFLGITVFLIFKKEFTIFSRFSIVLVLLVTAIIVQHFLFNILFPIPRTALYFIPIYSIALVFAIDELLLFANKKIQILLSVLIFLLTVVPLTYHLISNIQTKYSRDWPYDSNTKTVMNLIYQDSKKHAKHSDNVVVSNDWIYEPTMNFYRKMYKMENLSPINRDEISLHADYIYTSSNTFQNNEDSSYVKMIEFVDTETVILKRK